MLPPGTFELVAAMAGPFGYDARSAADLLMLPRLAATASGEPPPPFVVGAGAIHRDLVPEDEALWETFVSTLGDMADDPEAVAEQAQLWRMPVTPYRRRGSSHRTVPLVCDSRDVGLVDGIKVLDLTSTWAGPLATRLLADAGAEVIRIEPTCRPDRLRDGLPDMYRSLSAGKQLLDLDLRRADDHERFRNLVVGADVVIEAYSRRVMPNFGLTPDELRVINPRIVTVSMPAFPGDVSEAHWTSFGTGIHAISGLGDDGAGGFWAPAVSYPDPLGGLAAAATVVRLLQRRRGGERGGLHAEVSLLSATRPLL